jgi:hypothetical protein
MYRSRASSSPFIIFWVVSPQWQNLGSWIQFLSDWWVEQVIRTRFPEALNMIDSEPACITFFRTPSPIPSDDLIFGIMFFLFKVKIIFLFLGSLHKHFLSLCTKFHGCWSFCFYSSIIVRGNACYCDDQHLLNTIQLYILQGHWKKLI